MNYIHIKLKNYKFLINSLCIINLKFYSECMQLFKYLQFLNIFLPVIDNIGINPKIDHT